MTKKELRTLYKQKRKELSPRERSILNDLLLIQFQRVEFPHEINTLLSYWPLEIFSEIDTHLMTDFLAFRIPELTVAYPVSDFDSHSMKIIAVDEDTNFSVNKYGIAEPDNGIEISPADINLIFVPMLAFDKNGFRVGYGKGFYDRLLANCNDQCTKVGFSWFDPVDAISDIGEFDVPLNIGITPNAVYEF